MTSPGDPPPLNPLFQVGLDVRDRLCLVIGGGHEAEDKAGRLMEAWARVRLVSPDVTPALRQAADDGCLEWHERLYEPADLEGAFLVMNTVRDDEALVSSVFEAASARGILVNTYDDIPRSHFGMAALVRSGPLRVSISTSNASPSLASRLRQDLEAMFDDEVGEYLEALGRVRNVLKERVPTFAERRRLLRGLVEGAGIEGVMQLPCHWRARFQAVHDAVGQEPGQEPGTKKPG
jgi:siroheme synthase-like protein